MAIDGAWDINVQSPTGEKKSVLLLTTDGNRVSGSISGTDGTAAIKDAKVVGDVVSWSTDITTPMAMTLDFSGTVRGNAMSGQVKLGMFGNAPFTGVRD